MSARLLPLAFCLATLVLSGSASAATKSGANKSAASAKSAKSGVRAKSHSHSGRRPTYRVASRLVPPPPAYMPSILPELYYRGNVEEEEEEEEVAAVDGKPAKPKNPYAKYFYSRDNVVPKAAKTRSGVTTWSSMNSGASGVTNYAH